MKQLFCMAMLMTISLSLLAQTKKKPREKATFGVRLGGHFTKFYGKDYNGDALKDDFLLGSVVGVNVEIPVAKSLYVQLGLQVAQKGAKEKQSGVTNTVTVTSVELPVIFLGKFPAGKGKFLAGIGGYAAYGIVGRFKQSPGDTWKINFKNSVANPDPNKPYMKPLDAGGILTLGYQFSNRITVQAVGQIGILDITTDFPNDPANQSTFRNIGIGLSVGYRFH